MPTSLTDDGLIFCPTDVPRFVSACFLNQVHKSKFTYMEASQTVSFIIFALCCAQEGDYIREKMRAWGENEEKRKKKQKQDRLEKVFAVS